MNTTNIFCVKQNLRKYPRNIAFLWNKSYDLKHQPAKLMRSDLETWKEWHKFESILWNMQMEERTKVAEYEKRYVVQKRWNLKLEKDLWFDSGSFPAPLRSILSLSLNENKTSTFQTFELLGQDGGESIKVGWNFGGNTAYIHLS